MGWVYAELAAIALAAMLSPTTLTFSSLALVLGDHPLRTGMFFFLGAFGATIAIGIVASFVLGDAATSSTSTPTTWVAVVDIVAGVFVLAYIARAARRPPDAAKGQAMIEKMGKVAGSPAVVVLGAGAVLANPGLFIPLALKTISETDPGTASYGMQWLVFTVVSLLPLLAALILLVVAPGWAMRLLGAARRWLERRAMTVAFVILALLAAALLRNGIAGLTA